MISDLMAQFKTHSVNDLYALREKLTVAPVTQWLPLINEADPVTKMRLLYRMRDKFDAIITKFFFGTAYDNYFDQLCLDLVDFHKLDGAFMALCHHLVNMARAEKFSPERMAFFQANMAREFTLRDYCLPDVKKRARPESQILTLLEYNPFIAWDLRMRRKHHKYERFALNMHKALPNLMALLYDQRQQLNTQARDRLTLMAMTQPGKLLMFLT